MNEWLEDRKFQNVLGIHRVVASSVKGRRYEPLVFQVVGVLEYPVLIYPICISRGLDPGVALQDSKDTGRRIRMVPRLFGSKSSG